MLGVDPLRILQEHNARLKDRYVWDVANPGLQTAIDRDSMLTIQDIRNCHTKIDEQTWKLHPDESQGIYLWVQQQAHEAVFHYNPGGKSSLAS